jgi:hypothetical protein
LDRRRWRTSAPQPAGLRCNGTLTCSFFRAPFSNRKARRLPGFSCPSELTCRLKFFVEVTRGARDVDASRNTAFAVLHALDDTRRLVALGTVGRLRRVHFLLTVTCFCNLGHRCGVSPFEVVSAHTRRRRAASTARSFPRLSRQKTLKDGETRSPQFTSWDDSPIP